MDVRNLLEQYVFLGQEYLTWLWFLCETEGGWQPEEGAGWELLLGDRLVLGPVQGQDGTRVTVKGREVSLAEAREGLRQGKMVESLRLGLVSDGQEYWLTIKAADLGVASLKLPPTAPAEGQEDRDGLVLERIALAEQALGALDGMLAAYLRRRLHPEEGPDLLSRLKAWANGSASDAG